MDNRFFNIFASIGCSTFILGMVLFIILLLKGQIGTGIISVLVISIASFILFIIGNENLEKNKRNYKKYIASFRPEGAPMNETRVFEPDSLLARLAINEDTEHICLWEPENFSVKKPLKDLRFNVSRFVYSEIEQVELLINQQLAALYPSNEDDLIVIEEPDQINELQLNIRAAGTRHRLLFYQIDTTLLHSPLKKDTPIYDKQLKVIKECFFIVREMIELSSNPVRKREDQSQMNVTIADEAALPSQEIQIEGDPFAGFADVIHQIKEKQKRLEEARMLEEEQAHQLLEQTGENQFKESDTLSEFEKFLEQNKQKQHGSSQK